MYCQLHKTYGFGDTVRFNGCDLYCPDESAPDDVYAIYLYYDYVSDDYDNPLTDGMVIACRWDDPEPLDEFAVSFDPLT